MGEPVWQEVPGEYRADLRRLIVVQGDTEPASVEQQRHLCITAPSLYDLRNLFQVNVEEGRHLWAMVYLLHRYFGRRRPRRGRRDARAPLRRRRQPPHPRRVQRADARLAVVLLLHLLHRPRRQVPARRRCARAASTRSSRTCDFMLKEEAHHMFVGASGIGRVVQRTVELMKEHDTDDVAPVRRHRRRHPAALPQLPLHRVARPVRRRDVDQRRQLLRRRAQGPLPGGATATTTTGSATTTRTVPRVRRRRASRPRGRRRWRRSTRRCATTTSADCQKGVDRWNRTLADVGGRAALPHVGFHRAVGTFAGRHVTPGRPAASARRSGTRRGDGGCRPTTTGATSDR